MVKTVALAALLALFSSATLAQELPSCEDLTDMADALDQVGAAFDQAGAIYEGDEIDVALGELVDALYIVAEVENNNAMTNAVNSLTKAYDDMDSERFRLSLDSVVANLDRLYRRDCY